MPDMEKVLKALEHHKETAVCNGCPYAGDDDTPQGNCPVYDDTLDLLREQEPVKPELRMTKHGFRQWIVCGNCHGKIYGGDNYCRHCGMAVKWDA